MVITGKPLYQCFNGEAVFFEWEKKKYEKCLWINSHLAVEIVGLSIHCFCLFSIFCSESGRQVSLQVLEEQRDVLDPTNFFFFSPSSSKSHVEIKKGIKASRM